MAELGDVVAKTEGMRPDLDMIKITSKEGHEFFVNRKVATVSGTIKVSQPVDFASPPLSPCRITNAPVLRQAMLSGPFAESRGEIKFPEIEGHVLEKVIQYMYYKVKYTDSFVPIPDFKIEADVALELLMAANFLNV